MVAGTRACGGDSRAAASVFVCAADFNCDGGTDGADIVGFFASWEAGGCRICTGTDRSSGVRHDRRQRNRLTREHSSADHAR